MLLQAYDFLHLFVDYGVTIQAAGSDQWGNIVAGADLVRRKQQAEVFGITTPLVTKADGSKFGKTESSALWLTRERTSPYAFYQFWLNTADADVERYLKIFTLLDREVIDETIAAHAARPETRSAQRLLAAHVTDLLHGDHERHKAEEASKALFSGDVAQLAGDLIDEAFASAPTSAHAATELDGEGVSIVDLLVGTSVAKSKRQAREFLSSGAVQINGRKVSVDDRLTRDGLLHGRVALIRRGKKTWHVTRWR
jgi:tyrosyl-tRNA synthetase